MILVSLEEVIRELYAWDLLCDWEKILDSVKKYDAPETAPEIAVMEKKRDTSPDLDLVRHEMARASGVIGVLYAMVRDYVLNGMIEEGKNGTLCDVTSDTINGLNAAMQAVMQAQEAIK